MSARHAGLVVTTVLAALLWNGCGHSSVARPNIILVTIDTLRADHLGTYGYVDGLTPTMDGLGRDGVVFERAFAPIAITHPSHASMLTGLYPRYHGIRWNGERLSDDVVSVAEVLRRAGYTTAAFVSYPAMLYRADLGRGFDVQSDPEPRPGQEYFRFGRKTNALAISWLNGHPESPLFLWVHYFEPHRPFHLRPYSEARFSATGYDGFLAGGLVGDLLKLPDKELLARLEASAEDMEALRTLYDGEVNEADACVADLIGTLRRQGLLANAVMVVAADHGLGLGEHGRLGHGPILWNAALHVPLMIRDFRGHQAPTRVRETVGLVDVAPTILELAGETISNELQGRSLVPAMRGEPLGPAVYFGEVWRYPERMKVDPPDFYAEDSLAVILGTTKLVLDRQGMRAFDLEADPQELDPRRTPTALTDRLRGLARQFLDGAVESESVELSQTDIDELRALGYLP